MTSTGQSESEARRDDAWELIHSESTLTLATAGEKGAWSAPVYYVFLGGNFYFFSSPQSRHIQQAMKSGEAAASLFCRTNTWQAIRGIQMQGEVNRVRNPVLSLKVISAYLQRYPFARDFFPQIAMPDLKDFQDYFQVKLYNFAPTEVYYMDNRYGFGSRQKIKWRKEIAPLRDFAS